MQSADGSLWAAWVDDGGDDWDIIAGRQVAGEWQLDVLSSGPGRWEGMEEREYNTLDSIRHYLKMLQAGFLAMETGGAEIRAWVGGINHQYFKYDHVRSRRQVGSTFKPLVSCQLDYVC